MHSGRWNENMTFSKCLKSIQKSISLCQKRKHRTVKFSLNGTTELQNPILNTDICRRIAAQPRQRQQHSLFMAPRLLGFFPITRRVTLFICLFCAKKFLRDIATIITAGLEFLVIEHARSPIATLKVWSAGLSRWVLAWKTMLPFNQYRGHHWKIQEDVVTTRNNFVLRASKKLQGWFYQM